MVVQCDKNLGPAIIEKEKYLNLAFSNHFNDTSTYKRLTPDEATYEKKKIQEKLEKWLKKLKK